MRKIAVLVAVLFVGTMSPAHAAKAKPKKIPSTHLRLDCPGQSWRQAEITYKVDKRYLLKFASEALCDSSWVKAQWGGSSGPRTTVYVSPGTWTDLWKKELNPLPTRRVDYINIGLVSHPCDDSINRTAGASFLTAYGDKIYRSFC